MAASSVIEADLPPRSSGSEQDSSPAERIASTASEGNLEFRSTSSAAAAAAATAADASGRALSETIGAEVVVTDLS